MECGTKRKPGKPKRGKEVITREKLEVIASLYLQNVSLTKIAKKFGVTPRTIQHHVDTKLKPVWRETMIVDLQQELAKVAKLEAEAWQHYKDKGDHTVLQNVRWAMEYRAKVGGLIIDRREVTVKGTIRIAGQTPEEFDAQTVDMILEDMGQRHKYQAALSARLN